MRKDETQVTQRVLIMMTLLMNVLILTSLVGIVWLVQIVLSQTEQLTDLMRGFKVI